MVAMVDKAIGETQMQYRHHNALCGEEFAYRRTGAAGNTVFFQRDQQLVAAGELANQVFIDGFYKAHISHGGTDAYRLLLARSQQCAKVKDRHLCTVYEPSRLCPGAGRTWFSQFPRRARYRGGSCTAAGPECI